MRGFEREREKIETHAKAAGTECRDCLLIPVFKFMQIDVTL